MQVAAVPQNVDLSLLYYGIGAVVVFQFGTLVTIAMAVIKFIVFITELKATVKENEKWVKRLDASVERNQKDTTAAHILIRETRKKVGE